MFLKLRQFVFDVAVTSTLTLTPTIARILVTRLFNLQTCGILSYGLWYVVQIPSYCHMGDSKTKMQTFIFVFYSAHSAQ